MIPIPNYQEFMNPVLKQLLDGSEKTIRELVTAICDELNFSDEQRNLKIPSGKQTYVNGRIGWAKTYLVQAGLVKQPKRGVCVITERGKDALASNAEINNQYLKQFPEFIKFQNRSNKEDSSEPKKIEQDSSLNEQTPDELLDDTFASLNTALTSEILEAILSASPQFFEHLVVDLMLAMGYGGSRKDAGQATQFTNDGGIDGIIKEDKLGLDLIYLQAKRYSDKTVGRPEIQGFAGALDMHRAKKGVFITTSAFSKDAQEYVNQIEKRIVLIDGGILTELMLTHNLGVSTKQVFEIKVLDTDYFIEE